MTEQATKNSGPDIDRGRIALVYSDALLGASTQVGNTGELLDEYQALVEQLLDGAPQFGEALASPRVSVDEKMGLLDRVFGGKLSDQLLTFLKVVCQHGRMDCVREIYRAARQEFNRRNGRIEVQLTTATEIDDQLRGTIVDTLQRSLSSEVVLQSSIDPSLLGGMVIRIGDTVYDGSVLNKLKQLKEQTLQKTRRSIRESTARFASE